MKHAQIKSKTFAVADLKPHPKNPKKHAEESISESIGKFGYGSPIVVDENGVILAGHGRLKALKAQGYEKVDCQVWEGLNEKQKEQVLLIDNKLTEKGAWDLDLLVENFDREVLEESYFEPDELDALFEPKIDLDEIEEVGVPEKPENPKSKVGDIYQLGNHRLMCADATKSENVEKLMDGGKAGMVFCDPPYNVDYEGSAGKIKNDKFKSKGEFYMFLYDAIMAVKPFVCGDVYICMSSSELHTLQSAFADCGGHWSTFIIWVKNAFTLGRSNYQRQYEPILYGWFEETSHYWSGARNLGDVYKDEIREEPDGVWLRVENDEPGNIETDIWEHNRPSHNKQHPTMKPIKLCARGVLNSSKAGDIVLDTFGGSGSTLIACEQTQRKCYTMELDPKFADVIIQRWEEFTGLKAKKL